MEPIRIVACQVYREEILKALESIPDQTIEVITFPPLCHTLDADFLTSLFSDKTQGIFFSCPEITRRIEGFPSNNHLKIQSFSHCCDLLLNNELIEHFLKTGAYIATPGWLKHWEQFIRNLKFSHNEIILLDTQLEQYDRRKLEQFAMYVGLPYKILPVGLSHLKLILSNLLDEFLFKEELTLQKETIHTLSDQALAIEIIAEFAETKTQRDTIEVIKTLLTNIFAPKAISFIPYATEMKPLPTLVRDSIQWSNDNRSFSILLRHTTTDFGTMFLSEIMFPEYRDRYVNLLYQIIIISGFALSNARTYDNMSKYEKFSAIGEMATAIAHEIRNPMTTVRGYLQFLQNKQGISDYTEQFNLMIEELDHANKIITEYLSLAKDRVIQPEYINLNHVISSIYPLIKANTIQSEITIKLSFGEIPDLWIDETEVRQLILNLTRNGIEAMDFRGTLAISTILLDNEILLEITDHGHGINSEILLKLGTPFLTTKETGTGLGLAVCYSIVAKYDGKITFRSDAMGTTVIVHFPLKWV